MKKLAILRCLNTSMSCTGSGCLKALRDKSKAFVSYADEEVILSSFFLCNGCDKDPSTDEGMLKKLDRLQKMEIDVVHTAGCTMKDKETQKRCPNVEKIVEMLQERGIQTVHGTHR